MIHKVLIIENNNEKWIELEADTEFRAAQSARKKYGKENVLMVNDKLATSGGSYNGINYGENKFCD